MVSFLTAKELCSSFLLMIFTTAWKHVVNLGGFLMVLYTLVLKSGYDGSRNFKVNFHVVGKLIPMA